MKSAAEIRELAREAGHDVSIIERPPPPEFPAGHWKYWIECTCGFVSPKKTMTQKNAALWAINHLVRAASDHVDASAERVNGGTASPRLRPQARLVQ